MSWKFDKRINIGDVLTTLVLAVVGSLAGFMLTMDRRLTVVEERQVRQLVIDQQQDERLKELGGEVRGTLNTIDSKLDKMTERQFDMKGRP